MAVPVVGIVTSVIGAIGGLFKKKDYVLWMWTGSEWQAVATGHSKTIKEAQKNYTKQGYEVQISRAGATPTSPGKGQPTSITSPLVYVGLGIGGIVLAFLFFRRKKR